MAKVSIPLPTPTQGVQPWIISGKEFCLSFAYSGSKPGDGFCDITSKGGIKKMLLAKAESFFSDPKALPGLQILKTQYKQSPKKNKARTSSFHYIILIASTPRNTRAKSHPSKRASFHGGSYFHTPFTQKKEKEKKKRKKYIIIIALVDVQTQSSLFTHWWDLLEQEGEAPARARHGHSSSPGNEDLYKTV